jgi:hypothetical protein
VPQSIPQGLTPEHVLQALADLDAGAEHPFGPPTGYELLHEGRRYAPKAVIGLAFRHARGRLLRPDEFSGGEAPGQANHVLRQLGFTVVKKAPGVDDEGPAGKDGTEQEVGRLVADYFAMLEAELLGKPYSKAEHRRGLAPHLQARSDGSIEFKHQNLSAVLVELGLPYIEGYKPRFNYQALLAREVDAFLDRHPGLLAKLADAPAVNPDQGPKQEGVTLDRIKEEPPERVVTARPPAKPWLSRKGRRIDFAERDAANRRLGKLGEAFVVWLERQHLLGRGRDDLAAKVAWVSETVGDGLGYDVRSVEEADESEKLIEVKTIGLGKYTPFYVTSVEVRCSEDVGERFYLYRVFDFGRSPRLYVLRGPLRETCHLEPALYRATAGGEVSGGL